MLRQIFILIWFIPLFGLSQKDSVIKKDYISFNGGLGTPLWIFGSNSSEGSTLGGYAMPGVHANIANEIHLKNNHGLFIMAGYNSNKYDINSYLNKSNLSSFVPPPYYRVVYSNDNGGYYKEYTLLLGYIISFPFKRFSLDTRFLIGGLYFKFPGVEFDELIQYGTTGYTTSSYYENKYYSANSIAVALDVGLTIKYSFSTKIYALINADIFYSQPNFNTIESGATSSYPYSQVNITSYVLLLNISTGIGYRF